MQPQLTRNTCGPSTPLQAVIDASPAHPARIATALFMLLFDCSAAAAARDLDVDPVTLSRALNSNNANGKGLRARVQDMLGVRIGPSGYVESGFPAPPNPSINDQNQEIAISR